MANLSQSGSGDQGSGIGFDSAGREAYVRRTIAHGDPMTTVHPLAAALAGLLLSLPAPVAAHHSFAAEFDGNNCRDFTGTLTKIDWQNPHAYFYLDVKDAAGRVESWSFQTYALITLKRAGTDRQTFVDNIGKEIWVRGC